MYNIRYDLLHKAMIEVAAVDGPQSGSGFFVAPGLALTSANLVGFLQQRDTELFLGPTQQLVTIHWRDTRYQARVDAFLPEVDLALLQVPLTDHPCVFIDSIRRDY